METITKLTFTTICYVTEDIELVKQCVLNLLPDVNRDMQINQFFSTSQFGDRIVIISIVIENDLVNPVLGYLSTQLSENDKQYLFRHFSKRIDLDEKSFYLRLDKFKLLTNEFSLTEGSDVVKVEIGYSIFTPSQNTEDNIRDLLLTSGLISE